VSVYTLTIEPFTPFAQRGVTVDEERAADDFELAEAVLAAHGLARYEVSNHARPGFESHHNRVYWRGDGWLALGPSAAGLRAARPGRPARHARRADAQRADQGLAGGEAPERTPSTAPRWRWSC
jgi:coproporphyrinogen III oxidase-like Fe-S oxidoreductase